MIDRYILDKNHLSYWMRQLRKEARLIGTMTGEDGDIVYREVDRIHDIKLDCPAILPTIKGFFFPQSEVMLRNDNGTVFDTPAGPPTVIFGLRSCDVSSLNIIDNFFNSTYQDPYYLKRRENTLLISIGCNKPDPTCFCMSLGTGPFLQEGFDIQLTDLGDRYFVEVASEKAKKVMKKFQHLLRETEKTDNEDQYEAVHLAQTFFEKRINLESERKAIVAGKIDDEFWNSIASRCFECGGCVYECPLCTCFNVFDRVDDNSIERIRVWDTCLFKGFTRLAGGCFPNAERVKRTKRWHYHKVVYYPEQLGTFGCVGCGRCTITCPGVIDMATVSLKISEGVGGL